MGLCDYDDKRYMLAPLANGDPNPFTHAYGHYAVQAEEKFDFEITNMGNDLVVEIEQGTNTAKDTQNHEIIFIRKHIKLSKFFTI